jgi:FkbM family methyltransferase
MSRSHTRPMQRIAPAVQVIRRGRQSSRPVARVAESASFHASRVLARHGRPFVRGRLVTGSHILLDVRDPAHREILWTGRTEPGLAKLLESLIAPGAAVVDVGANAGFYSLLAADLGARRVLAFEPNPRTASLLGRSATGTVVEVVQAACGSERGSVDLFFSPDPGKQAFATIKAEAQWSDDWAAWESTTVPLTTVDDECARRGLVPDLLKLDAEGAELEVLQGMTRLLEGGSPRHIVCEVAAGWERPDPTPWLALLRDAGYEAREIADDGTLIPFERPEDQSVQNVYFRRR